MIERPAFSGGNSMWDDRLRKPIGSYSASSFRQVGAASSPQHLATIEVTAGALRSVRIRQLRVDVITSAVTAYLIAATFRVFVTSGTMPGGGATATKHTLDPHVAGADTGSSGGSDKASQANTTIRFGASADSTAAAITGLVVPGGVPVRSAPHPLVLTGVGQFIPYSAVLIGGAEDVPLELNPNASSGYYAQLSLIGNSATHLLYVTTVVWDEVPRITGPMNPEP